MDNFFEQMKKMQEQMMEGQKDLFKTMMNSYNNMENFKNPFENFSNIFNNFSQFNKYSKNNFEEIFKNVPGYEYILSTYEKNLKILDDLYKSYLDLMLNGNFQTAGDNLLRIYDIFNKELIEVSKENIKNIISDKYYNFFDSISLDKFLKPYLEKSKNAIDFYEKAIEKEPNIVIDDIKKFYKERLDKFEKLPILKVNGEITKKNRECIDRYIDLLLKLVELNLFLNKKSRKISLEMQKKFLDRMENKERFNNFIDFYEYYTKNIKEAYNELVNSVDYKNMSEEIVELVKKNKEFLDSSMEKSLENLPIITSTKVQSIITKLEDAKSEFNKVKKENKQLQSKLNELEQKHDKEIKELLKNFDALKKEVEALKKK